MTGRVAAVLTAGVVFGAAAPVAVADSSVPTAGAPCSVSLASAYTELPDGRSFLVCQSVPGGYVWQPIVAPFNPSDLWFSYGPDMVLHGQGRRNPEVLAGQWVGTPVDAGVCAVSQVPVTDAGEGPAEVTRGEPAAAVTVAVPVVFSITLSGSCLWHRTAGFGQLTGS